MMVCKKVVRKVVRKVKKNKALQIAKKMLSKGVDVDSIMEKTGLTKEEVYEAKGME